MADESGIVIQNNSRLVAKGYCQQEGIDYNETYALVTILEAIRFFLAYIVYKNTKVHHLHVKSTFLSGEMKKEVYVQQPPGFERNLCSQTRYSCLL